MDQNDTFVEEQIINTKKHILTTYGWYLTVILFTIILAANISHQKTSKIYSAKREFNQTLDPMYLIHLTDVHITKEHKRSGRNFQKALKFIEKSKAETVTITGDLTDNWEHFYLWKEAKQNTEDHEYYKSLINSTVTRVKDFIDLSGNHDMFDVHSYYDNNNYFINTSSFYSKQGKLSYENFSVSTYESKEGVVFILINNVIYPAQRAFFDLFFPPPVELLNRIEDELIKIDGKKPVVLLSHYPAYHWFNRESKYGHTFREMNKIYNFTISLTGHSHPLSPFQVHHNQNVEIVGRDCFNHRGVSIVSIDNGNTAYHSFEVDSEPKAIITNPVPKDLLTGQVSFDNEDVDIRALVFTNKAETINVYEHEKKIGKLEFVRTVRDGVQLYHLKHKFNKGTHEISFNGYYEGTLEFFVGDALPPFLEYIGFQYNILRAPKPVYILLMIVLFIITFPVNIEKLSKRSKKFVKLSLKWLYNDNMICMEGITAYALGFLLVRWRILKLPVFIRIILFVGLFSPFIFPVVVQTIGGHWGVITTYGVYNSGILIPSIGGGIVRLVHMYFIEAPAVFLCSLFYDYQKFRKIYLIEYINAGFGIFFCIVLTFFKVAESTNIWFTLTSPVFILWPLFFYSCVIIWRKKCKNHKPVKNEIKLQVFSSDDVKISDV